MNQWPSWYWFRFDGLRVTVHLRRDRTFAWTRLCGLQCGPWFIGAIKGSEVPAPPQESEA